MEPVLHEVNGIRRFNDETIQKHVDAALAAVPEGKKGVILDVDLGPTFGARAVLAARLDKGWSIGMVGSYRDRRTWAAGVRAVKVFDW